MGRKAAKGCPGASAEGHADRPAQQADHAADNGADAGPFAAAHVGCFFNVQLALFILANNGRIVDLDQTLPFRLFQFSQRLLGA
jgi:hypothetical protein